MDLELNIEYIKQSLCKAIIDESAVRSHISRETGLGYKKYEFLAVCFVVRELRSFSELSANVDDKEK